MANLPDYIAKKIKSDIVIDGDIGKEVWQKANWSRRFADMVTGDTSMYNTQASMLWNDQFLYIAFNAEEPFVEARQTERDGIIFLENDLELFIDGGDCYYELEVNAANTISFINFKKMKKRISCLLLTYFLMTAVMVRAQDNALAANEKKDVGNLLFAGKTMTEQPGMVSYTYRNSFTRNVAAILDTIKSLGITNIEFSNLFGKTALELRKLLDERGMICTSGKGSG